jgi:hypothetical protein
MKVFTAAVLLSLACAVPAQAQYSASNPMPRYGETDKEKQPGEIAAERRADEAYKRSLGNIPAGQQSNDPWGGVRGDSAPKSAAKPAPPKPAKAAKAPATSPTKSN